MLIVFAFGIQADQGQSAEVPQVSTQLLVALGDDLMPPPLVRDYAYAACKIAALVESDWSKNFPKHSCVLKSLIGALTYATCAR